MLLQWKPSKSSIQDALMSWMSIEGLDFKWYMTVTYYFKETNRERVLEDCEHLKKRLRKKYKSGFRIWFFIELHRNKEHENYGGYHIHFLMEDPFSNNRMDDFSKMYFLQRDLPYLMKRCASGSKGRKVKLINEVEGGVRGLCRYLTKDAWKSGEYLCDVIDYEHSEIPRSLLDSLYDIRTLKQQADTGRVFA